MDRDTNHRNGLNGHGHTNGPSPHLRIPNVQEALPYSPFTSIIPFSADVVPLPLAYPSVAPSLFPSDVQRESASKMLDSLNKEAGNAERASERLQRTVSDLQHLLRPNNLTTYQFKRPATGSVMSSNAPAQPAAQPPQLNNFAAMIYQNTDIAYQNPSPDSSKPKARKSAKAAKSATPVQKQVASQAHTPVTGPPVSASGVTSNPARPSSDLSSTPQQRPALNGQHRPAHVPAPQHRAVPTSQPALQRTSSASRLDRVEIRTDARPSQPSSISTPQQPKPSPVDVRHHVNAPKSISSQNGTPRPVPSSSHGDVAVVIPPRSTSAHTAPRSPVKNSITSQQARKLQRDIADAHYHKYISQNGLNSLQEASRPSKGAPRPSQEAIRPSQEVPRPSQEPPRSSQTEVSVVIPRALTDIERAAYTSYPEMDRLAAMDISGLSKPKKPVVDHTADRHLMSATVDQREKANGVVTKLQTLVSDILEAEDQLQPDTSGNQSTNAARFFQVDDGADIERPILQTQTQSQLDLALQKVVNNGRFGSIDVEQLGRVMKLCENVITLASSTNYTIDSDTPHELDHWIRRIALCEQGLFASRSLLRIMTAGREEKQLYSEDTLRSLLNLLSHVADTCIIPIVEMRSDAEDAFKVASTQHKALFPVVSQSGRVLKLLGDLLSRTDVDESAITSAEFICKRLVFVENASSEKEAALGVQKFETIRLAAMDVLAKIFARYTGQRQFIFDEILTSLEKLPVSRQSARQFKLVDGKPIQLVSALLMRLVQTSATRPEIREQKPLENTANETDEPEDSDMDAEGEPDYESESSAVKRNKKKQKKQMKGSAEIDGDLKSLATPLYDAATKDAYYMINYLLQRAMTSTKTGDQPYRNLLDIFTEDFLGVLGNTDWPAAEMLLRALLAKLLDLTNSNKSSAPAKSMALELMGSMATRITGLRLQAQQAAKHQQTDISEITARLADLHEAILEDSHDEMDLLAFDGPNRALVEYLHIRDNDDPQLQTARGYHVLRWSKQMLSLQNTTAVSREVEKRLTHMIKDPQWLENEYDFPRVSTEDGRFASIIITLQMPFCLAFNKIFTKLLSSMGSDQASLRSKSLKSIEQLLEMDPAILDRGSFVMNNIIKCLTDTSTQVRDSALGLISKCLGLRPRLDSEVCERIVQRSLDANIHVRKRAMKMLKDIYLRNSDLSLRSHITDALVLRVVDPDEGVAELARHTFEDIWMIPLHSNTSSDSENIKIKSRLQEQTTLIVKVANKKNDGADTVLTELVQGVLSTEKSKNAIPNFKVCSQMVKTMFEAIIDPAELPGKPSQQAVLQTLTVFAAADAKLFTPDQLHMLQPYVKNLSSDDNLLVYRCAIVILRHTLPHMRNLNKDFLNNIQQSLFASFQRLPKAELKEVASCLWMLDGELKNTDRLVKITSSVLAAIKKTRLGPMDEASATKVKRLITIAGTFVKAFDLDSHSSVFSKAFPEYKGNSVAALAVDNICPFTSPKQPESLREVALESVSMICQSWPDQLMRTDVCTAFEQVFEEKNRQLEFILITGLEEFFSVGD